MTGFARPSGVFVSSYLGGLLLSLGEWIIKKLPLVKHVYSAAKQVSAAVNPSNETAQSFRECVIIRHPRHGEFAFGFITGQTTLQVREVSPADAGHCTFAALPSFSGLQAQLISRSAHPAAGLLALRALLLASRAALLHCSIHAWAACLHTQLLGGCLTSKRSSYL